MKKKSDQSQGSLAPAWHPNFRNFQRLPDTKVVRTQFFVNFAAIAITAGLLVYFCYQEYRISDLKRQVTDWQSRIDANKKDSEAAIVLSGKFEEEQKKVRELDDFLKQRVVLSQLLLRLGATLPKELALDLVDVRDLGVNLRGSVTGAEVEAAGYTSAYLEQLRQDEYFRGVFDDIVLNNLVREPATGRLIFDAFLRFKGGAAKK